MQGLARHVPTFYSAFITLHRGTHRVFDMNVHNKAPALAGLDEAAPQAFYLPNPALAQLCDACLVVEGGKRLPVHTQVLAMASSVLLEAFAAQSDAGGSADSARSSSRVSEP